MFIFIGLIVVAFIILYKRSTEIIVVNPMRAQRPAPDLRGPEDAADEDNNESVDFGRLLNTIQQAVTQPDQASGQGDEAIRRLIRSDKFIEAMQLYRKVHGVDLRTAKKAVDRLMLEP